MSILHISKHFFDKLSEENESSILRIYGYNDSTEFIQGIISFLNSKYKFLQIDSYEFLSNDEEKIYKTYNGYVDGTLGDYEEFLVSFSDIYAKEGNTIISQQLMPVLKEKIFNDCSYLLNPKIKRVFLLTSHKSSNMKKQANKLNENSSLQFLINCLTTLGFDVYDFIPIINLKLGEHFVDIDSFINNINAITSRKSKNNQFKQIVRQGSTIIGRFEKHPKGQEEKYFALRYLTAIMLNKDYKYDLTSALNKANNSSMIKMLDKFAKYINANKYNAPFFTYDSNNCCLPIIIVKNSNLIDELYDLEDDIVDDSVPTYDNDADISAANNRDPILRKGSNENHRYETDKRLAKTAIQKANYTCELDNFDKKSHATFISKSGHQYLEAHHLIPMKFQKDEKHKNLDRLENIVPLCPTCHRAIHNGSDIVKKKYLKQIFNKRISLLKQSGLFEGTFEEFYNKYYK